VTESASGRAGNWSLYVHVPFCKKKCPYCDFFSVTDRSLIPAYVDGVCQEIRRWSEMKNTWLQAPLKSLYFGGGTPSVLSISQIGRILETVCQTFAVAIDTEITLEVNPGTVDAAYLSGVRQLGINRLSIGAQSFDPAKLSFLSRIHTRAQVFEALSGAARAGFSNLGLDLMYALPGETMGVWQTDLDAALALQPPHLSCYMLTLEPGTPLFDQYQSGRFKPCGPERRSDFFVHTSRVLENAGYAHYEVSNFAKDRRFRSVHNTHYWDRGPYIGAGPSAHSFLPQLSENPKPPTPDQTNIPAFLKTSGPVRFWNPSDIRVWLKHLSAGRLPLEDHEILNPDQEMMERIMLGLRTDQGIDIRGSGRELRAVMAGLAGQGLGVLGEHTDGDSGSRRFRLTRAGLTCLDSLVDALIQKIPG